MPSPPAPQQRPSDAPEVLRVTDVSELPPLPRGDAAAAADAGGTEVRRPIYVKKAPPLPGMSDHPEPADLGQLARLPIPDLVTVLRRYGIEAHAGTDRSRLLLALMRASDRLGLQLTGEGQIELMPDGFGFLRCSRNTFLPAPDDLYVSPGLVKAFKLHAGMHLRGKVKRGRRKDKYFAIEQILSINDKDPEHAKTIVPFDDLTPVFPDKRILLETHDERDFSARVVDIMAPIGFGQRGLIVSPPRAGKTMLLKALAHAITTNYPQTKLLVFLVDERPEEVTDMLRSVRGEVIASTFDEPPQRHVAVSDRVDERARSLVESGYDVVLLIDSITRLGRAFNAAARTSGRILSGGLESKALQKPKRLFSAARNIEGGGSLTILATALIETNSRMDEVIFEEFKGTGNMEIVLSRAVSELRIFPAIDVHKSGTRMENLLFDPQEAQFVTMLRAALADLTAVDAIEQLLKRMKKTSNNVEFLLGLKASKF